MHSGLFSLYPFKYEKMWVKALVTTDFRHDSVFTTMHYPYFDSFLGVPSDLDPQQPCLIIHSTLAELDGQCCILHTGAVPFRGVR